jgi:hypothetical protein
MQGFSRWLQDYVEICNNNGVIIDEITNLAAGPLFTVTRYKGMDINGYTFYNMTEDTSPNSWELTKHRTCKATIVKKSIYKNQGRKSKPDFC